MSHEITKDQFNALRVQMRQRQEAGENLSRLTNREWNAVRANEQDDLIKKYPIPYHNLTADALYWGKKITEEKK